MHLQPTKHFIFHPNVTHAAATVAYAFSHNTAWSVNVQKLKNTDDRVLQNTYTMRLPCLYFFNPQILQAKQLKKRLPLRCHDS